MRTHPYKKYESLPAWKIVDEAISALVANHDIKELTARTHIVGYIVERLTQAGSATNAPAP
jgi:hypothetical protein